MKVVVIFNMDDDTNLDDIKVDCRVFKHEDIIEIHRDCQPRSLYSVIQDIHARALTTD